LAQAFGKQHFSVVGSKQNGVDIMDLPSISDEELQQIVRKKLLGIPDDGCAKQEVIAIDGVESCVSQGREYIASLPVILQIRSMES